MKIVIDIPTDMYEDIRNGKDGYNNFICTAIRNSKHLSDYMKTLRLRILHDFDDVKPKYWYTACTQIEKSIKKFMDNDYKYEKECE